MSFGAVAAIGGAVIGSMAAGDAADSQAASAANATAAERAMFDKQVELQAPFREAGLSANNRLAELLGLNAGVASDGTRYDPANPFANKQANAEVNRLATEFGRDGAIQRVQAGWGANFADPATGSGDFGSLTRDFSMADFEADPGYQFRMDEGTKAVEGGAAARGGLLSGAAQKALLKYGQNFASNEFGNAYQRDSANKTNKFNRLQAVVGTGTGATTQTANAAGQFGQQQAGNIIGAGNAQAAGQIGQANALVGGINGAFNNYQSNQLMNQNNELMKLIQRPGSTQTMDWYN